MTSGSPNTTTLRVLLFSVLREKVGQAALDVPISMPATGEDLLDVLAASYPAIEAYRPVLRLAVNQAYVPASVSLHEGDEIALITPVSGG